MCCLLPAMHSFRVEKENETKKKALWERSAVPEWALNFIQYMTQYTAYTTYTITMNTQVGNILHHHQV